MADDNRSPSNGLAEVKAGIGDGGGKVCPVVGIGGSAGSLDVFKEFLRRTPPDTGLAFVAIQHLAPDHESVLAQLLGRCTPMAVVEAEDRMPIEPNHVYVIAPGTELTMVDGELRVQRSPSAIARRAPIDAFFLSLAEACGENAACILLSGSGHDGTRGLRDVKEKGGLTIVQSAETAAHDSMLTSAIRTGAVDLELPVEDMPGKLVEYFEHLKRSGPPKSPTGSSRRRSRYSRSVVGCAARPATISASIRRARWSGASSAGWRCISSPSSPSISTCCTATGQKAISCSRTC